MKYTVVTGCNAAQVSESVMKLLDDGWYLQGGIVVDNEYLAQALIRPSSMGDWERPEFKRNTVYVKLPLDKVRQS